MDAKAIRQALNAIPDAALGALAMALPEIRRLRAVGLRMGQLVYFNAAGPSASRDYVANYYRARVMMLDKSGNVVLGGKGVTAVISVDSILSEKAWKQKRAKLVAKQAIFDPKSPFTWERRDEAVLINPKYRPDWLDKKIAEYRTSYLDAKATRQTHDYDAVPVKRGRGRPRKDGSSAQPSSKKAKSVQTRDLSPTT